MRERKTGLEHGADIKDFYNNPSSKQWERDLL
jgi:hypothetical protein